MQNKKTDVPNIRHNLQTQVATKTEQGIQYKFHDPKITPLLANPPSLRKEDFSSRTTESQPILKTVYPSQDHFVLEQPAPKKQNNVTRIISRTKYSTYSSTSRKASREEFRSYSSKIL